MGFDFGYFELIASDDVVIFAAAFRAMAMEGGDDVFMFAFPALPFRMDVVDLEDAILEFRVFNRRRPAVEKIPGDDSGRFAHRQRAFTDYGEFLIDHEFLKGID